MKFLNESYCVSCTNSTGNGDGSDRCGTRAARRKSDDSNGTYMCIRKRRIWHLFETGLPPDETSRLVLVRESEIALGPAKLFNEDDVLSIRIKKVF